MRVEASRHRDWRNAAAVLVIIGMAAALTTWYLHASRTAQTADAHRGWAELVGIVHEVSGAALDEVVALGSEALDDPSGVAPRTEAVEVGGRRRDDALRTALDDIAPLLDDPGVGEIAQAVQDLFRDAIDQPEAPTPEDLLELAELTGELLGTTSVADPMAEAMVQVAQHAWLPRFIARDALDLRFLQQPIAAAWADGLFSPGDDYIPGGEAGWLSHGGDPLPSPYVPEEQATELLPAVWADIVSAFAAGDMEALVAFDGWITTWPERISDTPPTPPTEVLEDAALLAGRVDRIVGEGLSDLADEQAAAVRAAGQQRLAAAILLAGLLVAATVGAVRTGRAHRGQAASWRSAALMDQLTGIPNRRGLVAHAEERRGVHRDGQALLLFDLDHFKGINDRFGHAIGDEALVALAEHADAVAAKMPGPALAARLGGDEFVILALDLSDPGIEAGRAARRLLKRLARSPVDSDHGPLTLSASIGVATSVGPLDLDDLLLKADLALYEVKRGGRGAHAVYQP